MRESVILLFQGRGTTLELSLICYEEQPAAWLTGCVSSVYVCM